MRLVTVRLWPRVPDVLCAFLLTVAISFVSYMQYSAVFVHLQFERSDSPEIVFVVRAGVQYFVALELLRQSGRASRKRTTRRAVSILGAAAQVNVRKKI